jgi:hypothetical protein
MVKSQSLLILLLFPVTALASSELDQVGIYHRCYAHLVKDRPPANDPRLTLIRAGSLSGTDACLQVLESAELIAASGTTISNTSDTVARKVIQNLHNFHHSWFGSRRFQGLADTCGDKSTGDILDATQPAAYITRALLKPGTEYKSIVTSAQSFQPLRENGTPNVGAQSLAAKVNYAYRQTPFPGGAQSSVNFPYIHRGAVIGVQPAPAMTLPNAAYDVAQNLDLKQTFGGGILGDPSYLLQTVKEDPFTFEATGSLKMPRKWAKSFFADLMCRELPLVRLGDGAPWVNQAAAAPFRKSNACIQCHVTMDRMAGAARHLHYGRTFDGACTDGTFPNAFIFWPVPQTQPAQGAWSLASDTNFGRRPPEGVLYFRSFDGKLIHKEVTGLTALGAAISDTDDLYACAAKRYYEFFTGISVDLNDPGANGTNLTLNEAQKKHRDRVIAYGKSLKTHQSLKTLVREILSSDTYRSSTFGVTE